jgi:hypothetical protein
VIAEFEIPFVRNRQALRALELRAISFSGNLAAELQTGTKFSPPDELSSIHDS